MKVNVTPASLDEKAIVSNLMRLYRHDLSEFNDSEQLDEKGLFRLGRYFDLYWIDDDRHPFLIRVDGAVAGFALINQVDSHISMSEFFIVRGIRRKGVGFLVAKDLISRYPGPWQVHELRTNVPAQKFWRRVIEDITEGKFVEDDSDTRGPRQIFTID